MRVEVALGRAVEGRVLGILSAVMILDVLQALAEVLVMIGLTPVSLIDDVRKQSGQLTLADFCLSQAKARVTF